MKLSKNDQILYTAINNLTKELIDLGLVYEVLLTEEGTEAKVFVYTSDLDSYNVVYIEIDDRGLYTVFYDLEKLTPDQDRKIKVHNSFTEEKPVEGLFAGMFSDAKDAATHAYLLYSAFLSYEILFYALSCNGRTWEPPKLQINKKAIHVKLHNACISHYHHSDYLWFMIETEQVLTEMLPQFNWGSYEQIINGLIQDCLISNPWTDPKSRALAECWNYMYVND